MNHAFRIGSRFIAALVFVFAVATCAADAGPGSQADDTSTGGASGIDEGAAPNDTRVGSAAQPLGLSGLNEAGGVCTAVADDPCGGDLRQLHKRRQLCRRQCDLESR